MSYLTHYALILGAAVPLMIAFVMAVIGAIVGRH